MDSKEERKEYSIPYSQELKLIGTLMVEIEAIALQGITAIGKDWPQRTSTLTFTDDIMNNLMDIDVDQPSKDKDGGDKAKAVEPKKLEMQTTKCGK